MSDLDQKRLRQMDQRGGLPTVDELVAMWRVTGSISFRVADERAAVTEARRRIRQAAQRLGKARVQTFRHKASGRIVGLMEYSPEEETAQSKRLRAVLAELASNE